MSGFRCALNQYSSQLCLRPWIASEQRTVELHENFLALPADCGDFLCDLSRIEVDLAGLWRVQQVESSCADRQTGEEGERDEPPIRIAHRLVRRVCRDRRGLRGIFDRDLVGRGVYAMESERAWVEARQGFARTW